MQYYSLQRWTLLLSPVTSQLGAVFALAPSLRSSRVISPLIPSSILGTYWPGKFKLDLEKAEKPEIKLPTSAGSSKKQEKYLFLLYWLCQSLCVDHNKLWKILKEMGIPYHLTCLLRNLYAGQEATVRTGHETTDWFQIGKGVHQGCILSPCLFNFYAEHIIRNTLWMKQKLESRLPGEVSITSDMQMTPPLWQKVKR